MQIQKVNNNQPNFKAVVRSEIKLKQTDIDKITDYVKNWGSDTDVIVLAQEKISGRTIASEAERFYPKVKIFKNNEKNPVVNEWLQNTTGCEKDGETFLKLLGIIEEKAKRALS